ncbi:uncharacterized protein LOC122852878 [Aphidius gifuensis]|uniref:uncharacterized protein LOC122852878 n=1 Tax=Aphidius gifuensis TaxID=684658 RepID=UPI001CDCF81B|nr:uncharacterized protein LOC122852878 [Aphidius gifuensis]
MADDSLSQVTIPKDRSGTMHRIQVILKIVQVCLAILIVGISIDPPFNHFQRIFNKPRATVGDIAIIYTAIIGYMIINMLFLIGHVLGDRIPKKTLLLFSSVGAVLHIVAASMMIHTWRKVTGEYHNNAIHSSQLYNNLFMTSAILTFLNAALFGGDVVFTLRYT